MGIYPLALRKRIIDAYLAGEGSQRDIAKRFLVSPTTVKAYLRLYQETGELLPREHNRGRKPAVSTKQLSLIKALLEKQPDMTLTELCTAFKKKTGIKVSSTSMYRAIKKINWTYKKSLYVLRSRIEKMLKQSGKYFYSYRKLLKQRDLCLLTKQVCI